MGRKLSDAQVAEIRENPDGLSAAGLAERYGVTRRHIGRLLRGEQRQQIGGLDRDLARASMVAAVEHFLAGLQLDDADRVLAETALALGAKIDGARASDTAASAAAMPALARQLIDLIRALRGDHREPDALDELRARRAARRLAAGYPL